jgi:single-strand DNA-binding protein
MNKVILIGNLTKDPEIKVTSTGKKLAKFSLAINDGKTSDGKDLTQYFNLTAWERTAEIIEMYVKKGHKVCIVGSLQNRSWDKPDGTKGYATDVLVRELEMLTSKLDAEKIASQNQATSSNQSNTIPKNPNIEEIQEEDQLPEIDVNDINVSMPF